MPPLLPKLEILPPAQLALSYFEGGDVSQLPKSLKVLLFGYAARCSDIPLWTRASDSLM